MLRERERNFYKFIQCLCITHVDQSMRRKKMFLSLEELNVEKKILRHKFNQYIIDLQSDLCADAQLYDNFE